MSGVNKPNAFGLKRFGIFITTLAMLEFSFSVPTVAQERKAWRLKSLRTSSSASEPDTQQIYQVLLKRLDRWNDHDLEGYLKAYWKSPQLLVLVDSEQFIGWQQLHDSYISGYLDRNAMGFIQPIRMQVRLVKHDFAIALTWWSASFPNSTHAIVGDSTVDLEKFDDGWKIVASHTSTSAN